MAKVAKAGLREKGIKPFMDCPGFEPIEAVDFSYAVKRGCLRDWHQYKSRGDAYNTTRFGSRGNRIEL